MRLGKERQLDQDLWEEAQFALTDLLEIEARRAILLKDLQSAVLDWAVHKGFDRDMRPELLARIRTTRTASGRLRTRAQTAVTMSHDLMAAARSAATSQTFSKSASGW